MIIDTHVHIGGEVNGFHMNEEMVLEAMKRYKIDFCVVSNADAGEMNHQQQLFPEEEQISQETALARTLSFAKKHPGKIGVAPWIKPYLQGLTPELEQMIRDNLDLICAIKLHPFHSNVLPTDERVLPYLELESMESTHTFAILKETDPYIRITFMYYRTKSARMLMKI